jgi:hypothetical protein
VRIENLCRNIIQEFYARSGVGLPEPLNLSTTLASPRKDPTRPRRTQTLGGDQKLAHAMAQSHVSRILNHEFILSPATFRPQGIGLPMGPPLKVVETPKGNSRDPGGPMGSRLSGLACGCHRPMNTITTNPFCHDRPEGNHGGGIAKLKPCQPL